MYIASWESTMNGTHHVCILKQAPRETLGTHTGGLYETNLLDRSCSVSFSSSGRKCSVGSSGGLPICG